MQCQCSFDDSCNIIRIQVYVPVIQSPMVCQTSKRILYNSPSMRHELSILESSVSTFLEYGLSKLHLNGNASSPRNKCGSSTIPVSFSNFFEGGIPQVLFF